MRDQTESDDQSAIILLKEEKEEQQTMPVRRRRNVQECLHLMCAIFSASRGKGGKEPQQQHRRRGRSCVWMLLRAHFDDRHGLGRNGLIIKC